MKRIGKDKTRTKQQITEHYEIEKELASKLKNATKEERKIFYTKLYDELYKRVPHHPQLTGKSNPELKQKEIIQQNSTYYICVSGTFKPVIDVLEFSLEEQEEIFNPAFLAIIVV